MVELPGAGVDTTQKIWETIRPLLSYLEGGPHPDQQQFFSLILRMIENYPPILVCPAGQPDCEEKNTRRKAFLAAILTRTFKCQAKATFSQFGDQICKIQERLLTTLLENDVKRWRDVVSQLVDLALRLVVQLEGLLAGGNEKVPPDLLSILSDMAVLQRYAEQEHDQQVRLLPDVLPADTLFGNDGRFMPVSNSTIEEVQSVLAALLRLFRGLAADLARFVPSSARLLHAACLMVLCSGNWAMKTDCLDIMRVFVEDRLLSLSSGQLLLQATLTVQVCRATLQSAGHHDGHAVDDAADIERVKNAFFSLLNSCLTLPGDCLELRCVQDALASLADESQLAGLTSSHQAVLAQMLVKLHRLDPRQQADPPDGLLRRCVRLGLVEQTEQLVWDELVRSNKEEALLLQLHRPTKRKADGEPTNETGSIIHLGEQKLWSACCSDFQHLLRTSQEPGKQLLDLLTVAKGLLRRILQRWPRSSVVVFETDYLSCIVQTLVKLVPDAAAQGDVLAAAKYLALILTARCPEADRSSGEESGAVQLLVGIASRPWLSVGGLNLADMRLGKWQELLINSLGNDDTNSSLVRESLDTLSLFPKQICPKWRLSVFKHCLKTHGDTIVRISPRLIGQQLVTASTFVQEIFNLLTSRPTPGLIAEIARQSGVLVCCLARCAVTRLEPGPLGGIELTAGCSRCRGERCASKGVSIAAEDLSPLFKLIGHEDEEVRLSLLSMLQPLSVHSTLSNNAARLLLNYAEDPQFRVRLAFSQQVHRLLEGTCHTLEGRDHVSTAIAEQLAGLRETMQSAGSAHLDTYLATLATAVHCEMPQRARNLLLDTLLLLFFDPSSHVAAYVRCLSVLQSHLLKERHHVLQWLAGQLCHQPDNASLLDYLCLLRPEAEDFVSKNMHHLLPPVLLLSARERLAGPVDRLARFTGQRTKALILAQFPKIFAHVVVHAADRKHLDQAYRFLKERTGVSMTDLISSNRFGVIEELLTQLSFSKARILQALADCALAEENAGDRQSSDRVDLDTVKRFLSRNLMASLSFLLTKLCNEATSRKTKLEILRSLDDLIRLLGPDNLTHVKHCLLACLKTAVNLCRGSTFFHAASVSLWSSFVRNIGLNSLEVIFPQVIVGLIFHLALDREAVTELLRFLLVENGEKFRGLVRNLIFLPDIPGLETVVLEIRGAEVEFRSLVQRLLTFLDHEAAEVRQQALHTLNKLLDVNMGALQGLLLRSDQTDSVVSDLIQKLMFGMSTWESDVELRLLSAQCLGKIGAVDPGRLVLQQGGRNQALTQDFLLNITSSEFCVKLILELVRAHQSSREPFILENCMYSIQEVLKIYEVKPGSKFGDSVLANLADSVREILSPLMSSMYRHNPKPMPQLSFPIYGTALGTVYKDWLVHFSVCLIENIRDQKAKDVFTACLPVLKKDIRMAEFLLPHMVISMVSNGGEEDIKNLLKEVAAIMSDDWDGCSTEDDEAGSAQKTRDKTIPVDGSTDHQVARTFFAILDHARAWLRAKYAALLQATGKPESQLKAEDMKKVNRNREYRLVRLFLEQISDESLANLSFMTGSYHRSAFHLDRTLGGVVSGPEYEGLLNSMQKLYATLEEPDLVVGVAALRTQEPGLDSLVLYHQAVGNFQDALCCYERQRTEGDVSYRGMIQCYLNIDQPAAAANLAAGLVAHDPELSRDLAPYQAEAAWQLGNWQQLESLLRNKDGAESCWEMSLSRVMVAAWKRDEKLFRVELNKARLEILSPLSAVSCEQGAYRKGFSHISRLAILQEVELLTTRLLLRRDVEMEEVEVLVQELESRLNYTLISWTNLDPILRVRRALFNLVGDQHASQPTGISLKVKAEVGESWLRSAKIARKAGQLQEAFSFLLEAQKYESPKVFLEAAKLNWERGLHTQAITVLKKGLTATFPSVMKALEAADGNPGATELGQALEELKGMGPGLCELCADGKLLLARYVEEAASVSNENVKKYFDHAKEISRTSDKIFYHQAKFFDKQCQKMTPEQIINQSEFVTHAAIVYLRSLRYGPAYLDECMPRLLTIWLDFAETIHEASLAKDKEPKAIAALHNATVQLSRLNKSIYVSRTKVPTYYFLTAFPQIVSRICHPHEETYNVLRMLMVTVFQQFPHQAFWHMVCVSKNRDPKRQARCSQVFKEVVAAKKELKQFLDDAITFSKKIDELCDKKTEDRQTVTTFRELLPSLPALFNQRGLSPIALPIQRNMVVTFPTPEANPDAYNPFPAGLVSVAGVEDQIQIMMSLVRPKKITLRGSDGRTYAFLAKPKDDLRRDCRLMDLACILNRMFRKEPEARKRDLLVRTYTVVPTNETSGLIEWVDNLRGLRQIINQLLKERGCNLVALQRGHTPDARKDSLEKKKECLRRCLEEQKCGEVSQASSVFREWFVRTFADPQAWFTARLAFTRTTAVMSIMGYMLGLGDRHLENINVDTTTGECFHVDMNSLFNINETYTVPETVPFRLTHNIVDGFGPLGIEGPYRLACQVTLKMMRSQKDLLMSVLRPFIFDPLVDWSVRDKSRKKPGGAEEQDKPGIEALSRVENRLNGCVAWDKKKKGHLNLPLSVEGQVDHIILEATSEDNLAVMYWGWAPYL